MLETEPQPQLGFPGEYLVGNTPRVSYDKMLTLQYLAMQEAIDDDPAAKIRHSGVETDALLTMVAIDVDDADAPLRFDNLCPESRAAQPILDPAHVEVLTRRRRKREFPPPVSPLATKRGFAR